MTARSGYTLPVFACAAAIAALETLRDRQAPTVVTVDLVNPPQRVTIAIEQAAPLDDQWRSALAITRSDPGENLDLTRHTPIWAHIEWRAGAGELEIRGGEGIGQKEGQKAIYQYAQTLLRTNLAPWLQPHLNLQVQIILPQGRALAQRTANAAFGVVQGLSLLGTSGIAQPLSAPQQLEQFIATLQTKARHQSHLVFCVGENGLDLARRWGVEPEQCVKTANWLAPLMVAAAQAGVQAILLLGYHGKLLKLAGGIFHTHHHLADARLEILTAHGVQVGLPLEYLQILLACPTTEAALGQLRLWDSQHQQNWTERLYGSLVESIDRRCQQAIYHHTALNLTLGSLLFDGQRRVVAMSREGQAMVESWGLNIGEL
jgi:cobalt-precorrin-5B (C1)-methyltransferase